MIFSWCVTHFGVNMSLTPAHRLLISLSTAAMGKEARGFWLIGGCAGLAHYNTFTFLREEPNVKWDMENEISPPWLLVLNWGYVFTSGHNRAVWGFPYSLRPTWIIAGLPHQGRSFTVQPSSLRKEAQKQLSRPGLSHSHRSDHHAPIPGQWVSIGLQITYHEILSLKVNKSVVCSIFRVVQLSLLIVDHFQHLVEKHPYELALIPHFFLPPSSGSH